MKWMTSMKPLIALMLCATISFGPGIRTVTAAPDKEQAATTPAVIQSVHIRGDGEKTELVIAISAPATYTSYKTTAPDRLVVDFSQVIPADSLAGLAISKGPVKGVTVKRYDTDAGVLTRMEIFLEQNIEPLIAPSMEKVGELKISFPGYVAQQVRATTEKKSEQSLSQPLEQAKQADTPAVPVTEKVDEVKQNAEQVITVPTQPATVSSLPVITNIVANGGGIEILATAEISDYKNFRLNKPERVVVDIPNAKLGLADKMVVLNTAGVSSARIGSYSDKIRIVFDAINGSLADASIKKTATGLFITFGSKVTKKLDDVSAAAPTAIQQTSSAGQATDKRQVAVTSKESVTAVSSANAQVEAVDFQVLESVTRIMVRASGSPVVEEPIKASGSISFRIKNVRLPRFLQRSFEARNFVSPVLRITPVLVKTKAGNDVLMRIALKEDAAFELRRETDIIYLDIKHPVNMIKPFKQPEVKKLDTKKDVLAASTSPTPPSKAQDIQIEKVVEKTQATAKREYTGRKITLEFADAEVRKIFQLLSEVSNKNFVLGDEVNGNISLKLVNVPWDQALDVILDSKGYDMRAEDNILFIRKNDNFKTFDKKREERLDLPPDLPVTAKCPVMNTVASEITPILHTLLSKYRTVLTKEGSGAYSAKGTSGTISRPLVNTGGSGNESVDSQASSASKTVYQAEYGDLYPDPNTNMIIINDTVNVIRKAESIITTLDVPKKQVLIEARMIEASTTFVRDIGVQWGFHYRDGSGSIAGINSFDTGFGGLVSTPPTSGTSGPGLASGISFGTLASNIKLDVKLSASASSGLIKIISSPRVITSYGNKAEIKQGTKIPYQNTTSTAGAVTQFIDAVLKLNVTPMITPSGNVVMDIEISNDSPGTGSPPPINTKFAKTQLTVRDEETVVIGGIYQDNDTDADTGVPLLMDTPFLGNLFKSNSKTKVKTEMLIFITPRLLDKTKNTDFKRTKCEIIR
jgi:type IV pilus assembly protein PilQ